MAAHACVCMFCAVFFLVSNATLGDHRTELNRTLPQLSQVSDIWKCTSKILVVPFPYHVWPRLCLGRLRRHRMPSFEICWTFAHKRDYVASFIHPLQFSHLRETGKCNPIRCMAPTASVGHVRTKWSPCQLDCRYVVQGRSKADSFGVKSETGRTTADECVSIHQWKWSTQPYLCHHGKEAINQTHIHRLIASG